MILKGTDPTPLSAILREITKKTKSSTSDPEIVQMAC